MDGMERAARIADKFASEIMKKAEQHHDDEEYDLYEELEVQAAVACEVAERIRQAAKKK